MTADEAAKYVAGLAAVRIERYQEGRVKAMESLRALSEEVIKNLMG